MSDLYPFDAVIFDMDGVITKTATVHAQAWKAVFDEFLRKKAAQTAQPFREFDYERDYLEYVDGKPRALGVKSFLESRGIRLASGDSDDPPDKETVYGLGNGKNRQFRNILNTRGVEVYPTTIALIRELKKAGIKIGVVSSSKNCKFVLEAAEVERLFDVRVGGIIAREQGLEGKPEGDIFVYAAQLLKASPARSVVVEDAISGVQAGRNGGFGLVVGVARSGNSRDLCRNGADIVVTDLGELDLARFRHWFRREPPDLFKVWDSPEKIREEFVALSKGTNMAVNPHYFHTPHELLSGRRKPVFFLDYDGTLTPIVDRPGLAVIPPEMKTAVKRLSRKYPAAIVSGRMREDVERLAGIPDLIYAGSHGFDIAGKGVSMVHPGAARVIPLVREVITELKSSIADIPGVLIEEKKFSAAVHYRLAGQEHLPRIRAKVDEIIGAHDNLRLMHGKKVFEILPAISWNKGRAIRWIMKALEIRWKSALVVYIGDDTTDEDAFRVVRGRGTGILVGEERRGSAADFRLASPEDVRRLFERLTAVS